MSTHDLQYIRDTYKVPANIGQRVEITNMAGYQLKEARIVGARGQYIRLHFDGEPKPHHGNFHPTSGIRYLPTHLSGPGGEKEKDLL